MTISDVHFSEAVDRFLGGENLTEGGVPTEVQKDPVQFDTTPFWKLLINQDASGRVLEIGAGSNSQIHHLFDCFSDFVLVDNQQERLASSRRLHAGMKSRRHVNYIDIGASGEGVSGEFDCILLWMPRDGDSQNQSLKSSTLLRDLLVACRSLLSTRGQLIMKTPNRFDVAQKFWSGMVFSTRFRAGNYLKSLKSSGYTSVFHYGLHSPGSFPSRYIAYPPCAPSARLLPVSSSRTLKNRLKQRFMTTEHLYVASSSEGHDQTRLQRLIYEGLESVNHARLASDFEAKNYYLTRKGKYLFHMSHGKNEYILKVPLNRAAERSEWNNAEILEWLAKHSVEKDLFPVSLWRGTIEDQGVFVETAKAGAPVQQSGARGNEFLDEIYRIQQILKAASLQGGILRSRAFDGPDYQRLVEEKVVRLASQLDDPSLGHTLKCYFEKHLHGKRLTFGLLHGDFSTSNIFVCGNKVTGIIDWETASLNDISVLDSINYIDSLMRWMTPGRLINSTIPALARMDLPTEGMRMFLERSFELYGVDLEKFAPLVHLRWLRHVDYLLNYWLAHDKLAQQRFIYDVVETF